MKKRDRIAQNLAAIIASCAIERRLNSDRMAKSYLAETIIKPTKLKDLPIDCRLSRRLAMQLMAEGKGTLTKTKGEYYYSPNVQLSLF